LPCRSASADYGVRADYHEARAAENASEAIAKTHGMTRAIFVVEKWF
jgi:hypothetical protein